jgi:hypothetical protein
LTLRDTEEKGFGLAAWAIQVGHCQGHRDPFPFRRIQLAFQFGFGFGAPFRAEKLHDVAPSAFFLIIAVAEGKSFKNRDSF